MQNILIPQQVNAKKFSGIKNTKENHEFISTVSHNIKNPFSTLLGFSELLNEDFKSLSDEDKSFYVNQIESSAKHSFNYFERFLEWINLMVGRIEVHNEVINLDSFLNELSSTFEFAKVDNKVKTFSDLVTDYEYLFKILSYTLDFVEEIRSENISLIVNSNSEQISFEVNFTNSEDEHLAICQIFESFTNLKNHTSLKLNSHEINLEIVKLYSDLLGAKSEIYFTEGYGSTFKVNLPLVSLNN